MSEPVLCSNTSATPCEPRERWKQINHPTYGQMPFDVSTYGRIRNRISGHIARLYPNSRTRYLQFHYHRRRGGARLCSSVYVAPCVCRAFKRDRKDGETIEHMNQDRNDNRNSNLRYVSMSKNVKRSYKLSQRKPHTGGHRWTADSYRLIRQMWKTGRWSQVRIAKACGTNNVRICLIVNRTEEKAGPHKVNVDWSVLAGTKDQIEIAKVIMEVHST